MLLNPFIDKAILFSIFALALLFILHMMQNEEHDNLFLFIMIAFIIYEFSNNFIFVLGIPIIMLIILRYIKHREFNYNFQEGFDMVNDNFIKSSDKLVIMEWISENIDSENNIDYLNFTDSINEDEGLSPLKNIIEIIKLEYSQSTTNETESTPPSVSYDGIDRFIKYIKYISAIDDIDAEEFKTEVNYVKSLVEQINDYFDERLDQENIQQPEINVSSENEDSQSKSVKESNKSSNPSSSTSAECNKYKDAILKMLGDKNLKENVLKYI